jgi:hypothetical protein
VFLASDSEIDSMMETYMKRRFGENFDMQKFVQSQKAQADKTSPSEASMVQFTSNSRTDDYSLSQKSLVTMEDLQIAKNPAKEAPKQKQSEIKRKSDA